MTGSKQCAAKISRNEILLKYNIPLDSFVISYVGRHIKTKGYDVLKRIGKKILDHNKEICILNAGLESPLKGLNHERWVEVGWTNDPHSIISAANVFILPNKETYFDLIMLEVLSLGKIVIASNTGGNKFFGKIRAKGIFLYEHENEIEDIIKNIQSMSYSVRNMLQNSNKELFTRYFSNDVFVKNYLYLINNLDLKI